MVQAGQDLALTTETPDDVFRVLAALDKLDGYFFLKGLIGAGGEVNGTHASLADLLNDSIRTDVQAGEGACFAFFQQLDAFRKSGRFGKASFVVGRKQRFNLLPEIGIAAAGRVQKGGPARRFAIQCRVKKFFDLTPAFSLHDPT